MPRLKYSADGPATVIARPGVRPAELIPSVFGTGRAAEWAEEFGSDPICPDMMNTRYGSHRRIKTAFRDGGTRPRDVIAEIVEEIVDAAAQGHRGFAAAIESPYSNYMRHVRIRGEAVERAAAIWREKVERSLEIAGYPLVPGDPCSGRPRLTIVGQGWK